MTPGGFWTEEEEGTIIVLLWVTGALHPLPLLETSA